MDAHVVELAYTPVPKGRVTATFTRAQVQPVEYPRPDIQNSYLHSTRGQRVLI